MSHHAKKILLVVGILIFLVSACDVQSLAAVDAAGAPGAEPPPGVQIEPTPTPTPEGNAGDADQVLTLESIQVPIAPTGPEEPVSDVDPEDIPSPEELSATLDRVNLGGPERPGSDQADGVRPAPGTESMMGPANDSSSVEPEGIPGDTENAESIRVQAPIAPTGPEEAVGDVDPEDIPSPEERDAILEGVNLGGPERPGNDEAVGAGPAPGTESVIEPVNDSSGVDPESTPSGEERNDMLDRVNRGGPELPSSGQEAAKGPEPGTESGMGPMNDTEDVNLENTPSEAEDTDRHYLIRLIEALCNWLQEFFS